MSHSTLRGILILIASLAYLPPASPQSHTADSILTADELMMDAWNSETGVVLTKPVRRRIARLQADQFSKDAAAKGFRADEISAISEAINKSTLKSTVGGFAGVPGFFVPDASATEPVIAIRRPDQVRYLADLFSTKTTALFVEKFATVRLDVKPVPPRDYRVTINEEDCPPTEKGLYRVLPGSVGVNVTRTGKTPCAWNGKIDEGEEQLVSCNL